MSTESTTDRDQRPGFRTLVSDAGVDARLVTIGALAMVVVAVIMGGTPVAFVVVVLILGLAACFSISVKIPGIGFAAMMLASPLLLHQIIKGVHVVHLMALLGCLAVTVAVMVRPMKVVVPAPVVAAGFFVAILGMSAAASSDAFKSGTAFAYYLLGLGVAACIAIAVIGDRPSMTWILRGWVVGSVAVNIPTLLTSETVTVRFGGALVDGRSTGMFAQPNDFGEFALFAVFISAALILFSEKWYDRVGGVAALGISLVAVLESLSRGSWIGLVFGLIVLGVLVPRAGAWMVVAGGILLALLGAAASAGAAFASGLMTRASSVFDGAANPEDHRDLIWAQAQHMWASNPLTGVGLGRFREVTRAGGSSIAPDGAYHAHNAVLQFGAEAGVFAVVALAISTIVLAATVLRTACNRTEGDVLRAGVTVALFAGMVAVAGHALVDFVYTNPMLLLMGWAFFGLTAGAAAMPAVRYVKKRDRLREQIGPDAEQITRSAEPAPSFVVASERH